MTDINGVMMNLKFVQGQGDNIPAAPGIYAEIHWPTMNIRIGESKNMKSRNQSHKNWARKHKEGSHDERETRRQGQIVDLVKKWGAEGLEHFLISDDPKLEDRVFRVECEKELHRWAKTQTRFKNLNAQTGYRTVN
jgi:hypothetical protein